MQGGSRRRWPIRRRGHDFEPLLPFIWSPQSPCHCEPSCAVIPGARLCHFRRCLCLSFERFASLSFGAQREIFARKPRFLSRSLSPSFEAGSFEMTRVGCRRRQKGCFALHGPTALPWAIITPPRKSGARNHDHPNVASNGFVGASGCSPFVCAFVARADASLQESNNVRSFSKVITILLRFARNDIAGLFVIARSRRRRSNLRRPQSSRKSSVQFAFTWRAAHTCA